MTIAKKDNALVRFFYPLLERFLPPFWANKIKLCGCILAGDWMIPLAPWNRDIRELKHQQILTHFEGLEENSIQEILHFVEFCQKTSIFRENELLRYSSFIKESYFLTDSEIKKSHFEEKQLWKLSRRYGIKLPETPSLLYHHGLTLLDAAVHQYIAKGDFIDAGAYDGASALVFQKYQPHRVYSFEPSPANQAIYLATMKRNRIKKDKFELVNAGLSEQDGELHFDPEAGIATTLSETGGQSCKITSIDNYAELHGLDVKLIKADIEGMGLELLKGAVKTIKKQRPLLLLSVYHNCKELLGQYELLKSMNLEYEIKFCPLYRCAFELTLIAFPKELIN